MFFSRGVVTATVIFGLFTFSLSFTIISGDELFENDACKLQSGAVGICTINRNCPWFVSNVIRKKLIPYRTVVRCGFTRDDEIICCPKEQLEPIKQAETENSLGTRVSTRRAVQACQNFRGTAKLTFHIVEGEDAEEGDVPFIAALGYESGEPGRKYDWECGSSLISARFLLTAAHCVKANRRPVVARMGALNLEDTVSPMVTQDSLLKNFFSHPDYTPRSKYNDIALIEVATPFKYDDNVNSVCLHINQDDLPPTQNLIASGWGLTGSDEIRSDRLLKVNLTTEPLELCNKEYQTQLGSTYGKLSAGVVKTQYCAIGQRVASSGKRRDSCQGDSGGPLHYQNIKEERQYLVGVTSFGLGCGETASIYTRVAAYVDWIEPIVWPDSASVNE